MQRFSVPSANSKYLNASFRTLIRPTEQREAGDAIVDVRNSASTVRQADDQVISQASFRKFMYTFCRAAVILAKLCELRSMLA